MSISYASNMSRDASSRLRVIVFGYIVRGPLGGLVWHHLQYVMGLRDLGHDVYFVEDSNDFPSCYNPTTYTTGTDPTYGLDFAKRTFDELGLGARWAYYDAHRSCWLGPAADHILDVCATTDLFLHMSGKNRLRSWFEDIPTKVLIDTDPVFTQVRHLTEPEAHSNARQHDCFFSFGENIETGGSFVPNDGFLWRRTRQPIVLDAWPLTVGPVDGKFTTVMSWDSYVAREHNRVRYGMKSDSFEPYLDLPQDAGGIFELALGGASVPRELFRKKDWILRNPLEPTRTPWTYRRYIRNSKAEFSVAKHGYVATHSGWFSERSAAYLASGRPVVIQDTGFSDWLETGAGVLAFSTPDEALAAIEDVNRRYEFHCKAARSVAEQYFDARKVIRRLLCDVGI